MINNNDKTPFDSDKMSFDLNTPVKKKVRFNEYLNTVECTYSRYEYDRTPQPPVIIRNLPSVKRLELILEINSIKSELPIHKESIRNTVYYSISSKK